MRAAGKNLAGLDGTNVNDGAFAAFRDSPATEDLGAQPLASQVDVRETCPLLVCQVKEGNDRLDAGIVHQNIDWSEFFPSSVDHRFDVGAICDIALYGDRTPAFASNPVCNSL